MSREDLQELEELERINSLTAPRAAKHLHRQMQTQRLIQTAGRALLFLAGFLLGLAM